MRLAPTRNGLIEERGATINSRPCFLRPCSPSGGSNPISVSSEFGLVLVVAGLPRANLICLAKQTVQHNQQEERRRKGEGKGKNAQGQQTLCGRPNGGHRQEPLVAHNLVRPMKNQDTLPGRRGESLALSIPKRKFPFNQAHMN